MGNPTINTLVAGSYTEGPICYNGSADIVKSFTEPTISDPAFCTDTPWEYYVLLDTSSTDSPLP